MEKPVCTQSSRCSCCLSRSELTIYSIEQSCLEYVLQTKELILCYICKQLAKNAERFICNVDMSQKILKGIDTEKEEYTKSFTRPICLMISEVITVDIKDQDNKKIKIEIDEQDEIPPQKNIKIEVELDMTSTVQFRNNLVPEAKPQHIKIEPYKCEIVDDPSDTVNLRNFSHNVEDQRIATKYGNLLTLLEKRNELQAGKLLPDVRSKVKVEKKKRRQRKGRKGSPQIQLVTISTEDCLKEYEDKRIAPSYVNAEYKCEDCVKGFVYKPSYEKHMERHNKEYGNYPCEICKLRFACLEEKEMHIRCHIVRYKCLVCNLTRVCRENVQAHIMTEHQEAKILMCTKQNCHKTFKTSKGLRVHLLYQHNKERTQCGYCNKQFSSKQCYKAHVRRLHAEEYGGTRPVKKHVCQQCGCACDHPAQLRSHSAVHSDRKDYFCVECNKGFKTYQRLQTHLKTVSAHITSPDQMIPCPACSKRFATKVHARRHYIAMHTDNSYICDQCGKEYKTKSNLTSHMNKHAGLEMPRDFICSYCDKAFRHQRDLDCHIRTHTGEKPFQCPLCSASFNQSGTLYNHKRIVHKIGKLTSRGKKGKDKKEAVAVTAVDATNFAFKVQSSLLQ